MALKERIREALKDKNWSQAELARASGCERATVGGWFHGRVKTIHSDYLLRVARALDVTPEWLNGQSPNKKPYAARQTASAVLDEGMVRIPWLSATPSMGNGLTALADADQKIRAIETTKQWIRSKLSKASNPDNLRIVTGMGDSMAPTYADGDALFVDTGVSRVDIDAIFCLRHRDELFVKRVQRLPGGALKLISDNRHYDPITIDPAGVDDFAVIGRVIGAMTLLDL